MDFYFVRKYCWIDYKYYKKFNSVMPAERFLREVASSVLKAPLEIAILR